MKAGEKINQTNEMIKGMLEVVSSNYLIKQGFPAIVQNDQIVMRSIYGLNIFLLSWIEEEGNHLSEVGILKYSKSYLQGERWFIVSKYSVKK